MPISLELLQTQVGKGHSVTPDILKSTITLLKSRLQKNIGQGQRCIDA
jgi:hypothetical protein